MTVYLVQVHIFTILHNWTSLLAKKTDFLSSKYALLFEVVIIKTTYLGVQVKP